MPTIVESLAELSRRDHPREAGAIDYTAQIEVFDVIETGRVLVVWTATFPVPDGRMATAEVLGHAVFRDFVAQLRHELLVGTTSGAGL